MPSQFVLLLQAALVLPVIFSENANASAPGSAQACFEAVSQNFSEALNCYKQEQAAKPLSYTAQGTKQFEGVQLRRFKLNSQAWSPAGIVKNDNWYHDVEIYIPDNALTGKALLIGNNGTNIPGPNGRTSPPTNFTQEMLLDIVRKTRTIAITVSDTPNQYLTFTDDNLPRREDSAVAHSWAFFLKNPEENTFTSLHVPMMEVFIKTMDLAEKELKQWEIDQFLASGASKRAWAAWLAAIADKRIIALAPLVIDILDMNNVLNHTYRVYGKSWPLAFKDYQQEGITQQRNTENFDKLERVEDPLRYLNSAYAERLEIPKYIVNSGNDEFFIPDNTRFYFDRLPGEKTLRVIPNTGHDIKKFSVPVLIDLVNRLQAGRTLPKISSEMKSDGPNKMLSVHFSEEPVKLVQWVAVNPLARDFRFPCGTRYVGTEIHNYNRHIQVPLSVPLQGWSASFVEATFADGVVASTQVNVLPDTYPQNRPPEIEPGCKTVVDSPPH
ncbi:PhoPQ-activated protein PqaA family protein [Pseudomonas fluorescens]|uniref:PhoPQ-activated protein PqaA family protein n=1 Tax=Pseudomonas fluorescens TaxID=294 RepID=UPI001BEC0A27|nr:PhoPQ-activated protein PqaA family protein [Pseudomonas fluorescens]MBT2375386.1 PhoPQ-regulated protein [Pseudomonas fluorescens]